MDTALPTELPAAKDIRDLYEGLLMRDVEVQTVDVRIPEPGEHLAVAEYVDDRLQLRAVAVLDLALTVFSGAALGLLPGGGAQDMVKEKDPSRMVLENAYEVLNILASVFNKDGHAHVKLTRVHQPGEALTGDVLSLARSRVNRMDLQVSIPQYGKGQLAVVLPL